MTKGSDKVRTPFSSTLERVELHRRANCRVSPEESDLI